MSETKQEEVKSTEDTTVETELIEDEDEDAEQSTELTKIKEIGFEKVSEIITKIKKFVFGKVLEIYKKIVSVPKEIKNKIFRQERATICEQGIELEKGLVIIVNGNSLKERQILSKIRKTENKAKELEDKAKELEEELRILKDKQKRIEEEKKETTDGIILHAANLLGKKIVYLNDVSIEDISAYSDSNIYLLGHGNYNNYTINGRDAEYIADKLKRTGFNNQRLEILSCDAGIVYKSKCFYTELLKQFRDKKENIKCSAYGKTIITTKGYNGEVGLWTVYDKRTKYASFLQNIFLRKRKLYKKCKKNDFGLSEEENMKVYMFKKWLLNYFKSEMKVLDVMGYTEKIGFIFGASVGSITYGSLSIMTDIINILNGICKIDEKAMIVITVICLIAVCVLDNYIDDYYVSCICTIFIAIFSFMFIQLLLTLLSMFLLQELVYTFAIIIFLSVFIYFGYIIAKL